MSSSESSDTYNSSESDDDASEISTSGLHPYLEIGKELQHLRRTVFEIFQSKESKELKHKVSEPTINPASENAYFVHDISNALTYLKETEQNLHAKEPAACNLKTEDSTVYIEQIKAQYEKQIEQYIFDINRYIFHYSDVSIPEVSKLPMYNEHCIAVSVVRFTASRKFIKIVLDELFYCQLTPY